MLTLAADFETWNCLLIGRQALSRLNPGSTYYLKPAPPVVTVGTHGVRSRLALPISIHQDWVFQTPKKQISSKRTDGVKFVSMGKISLIARTRAPKRCWGYYNWSITRSIACRPRWVGWHEHQPTAVRRQQSIKGVRVMRFVPNIFRKSTSVQIDTVLG